MVRDEYGFEGYVIEMSGTPSPKTPLDWWRQCEIAWPGFLKEGSHKAMEARLAILRKETFEAGTFNKRVGWLDDERKCKHCGQFEEAGEHSRTSREIGTPSSPASTRWPISTSD